MLKTKSFLIVEFIGSFFLTGVVIGSGIMAENLSQGNDALALLGNTIATGAILFVLIKSFSPVSGAHFNPVVSLVLFIKKEMEASLFLKYIIVQFFGTDANLRRFSSILGVFRQFKAFYFRCFEGNFGHF